MFNVYEFEKRKNVLQKQKQADQKRARELQYHRKKNGEMGDNYRLRVGAFIKKMI